MSEHKEYYIGFGLGVTVGLGISVLSTYLYSSVIVDALLSKFSQTIKINESRNTNSLDKARDILNYPGPLAPGQKSFESSFIWPGPFSAKSEISDLNPSDTLLIHDQGSKHVFELPQKVMDEII